jgi:hypothetical protein
LYRLDVRDRRSVESGASRSGTSSHTSRPAFPHAIHSPGRGVASDNGRNINSRNPNREFSLNRSGQQREQDIRCSRDRTRFRHAIIPLPLAGEPTGY